MNNNQNNPQEVPQVKSGREKAIVSVNQTKYLVGYGRTAYIDGFECGYNQAHQRIAELEALNDKYREALEVIVDHKGDNLGWREIGMNSVDIAEQALNSKEVGNETKP